MLKFLYLITMASCIGLDGLNNNDNNLTPINHSFINSRMTMAKSINNLTHNNLNNQSWINNFFDESIPMYCQSFKNDEYNYCAQHLNLLKFCQDKNITINKCFQSHDNNKVLKINKLLGSSYTYKNCYYYYCSHYNDDYYSAWAIVGYVIAGLVLIILLRCCIRCW